MENNSLNFPTIKTILQVSSQILKYNTLALDFMPYIGNIPVIRHKKCPFSSVFSLSIWLFISFSLHLSLSLAQGS